MSIQPLPGDVVAQIKSSIIITSLNGVVSGLLQNSLDAGASKINVSVDYGRGNCSVEDDGIGIPPSTFHEDGGLGQLHYTSRYPPRADCHGRHGEFLASLGAMSLLTIASHHREYRSHNCLTMHNSKVIARNIPALPEQRVLSFASGARVTVRDLFGSMPVRLKQRAIELERLGSAKSFDQLVYTCVGLLLAWPVGITLSLRDLTSNRTVCLRTSTLANVSQNPKDIAKAIPSRTCGLLGQACLLEREDPKSWVSIGAFVPGVSLNGCVCLLPAPTKRVQFIALGIQPLLNENESNILYEEVNRVFANSDFGVVEEAELDEDGIPKKTEGFTSRELKPKRGIDRWPMFFIQIKLEDQMDSLNTDGLIEDSHRNLAMIIDLLQVMVYEFLKKHHFRPKAVNAFDKLKQPRVKSKEVRSESKTPSQTSSRDRTPQNSSRSPTRPELRKSHSSATKQTSRPSRHSSASPFHSWARVKSGPTSTAGSKHTKTTTNTPTMSEDILGATIQKSQDAHTSQPVNPLFDKSGELIRKPFDDVDEDGDPNGEYSDTINPIVWVDPVTKIQSLIDPRTGFMVRPNKNTAKRSEPHKVKNDKPNPRHSPASFLKTIQSQHNPNPPQDHDTAFQQVEPPIPRVPEIPDPFPGHGPGCNNHQHTSAVLGNINLDLPSGAGGASVTTQGRISKDTLQTAEILGQVDRKFILAKLATDNNDTQEKTLLILIDQHAADERCRVEELMREYFQPSSSFAVGGTAGVVRARSQTVNKPLRFELSKQEGRLLARYQRWFEHWGVRYEVFAPPGEGAEAESGSGCVTVDVLGLPPSIIERCRVEPRLLVELVRREVWRLIDDPGLAAAVGGGGEVGDGEMDWVPRFHHCPEGILEMINSRSCRSAIMFNDVLNLDQCVDLIQRLARCAFPFQCAHGRPSMVPIVDLGGSNGEIALGGLFHRDQDQEKSGELLSSLRKWAVSKKTEMDK